MSEPTAWINKERDTITFDNLFPEMTPLYEKREWVGLDLVDWSDFNAVKSNDPQYVAAWAEAKLKEKNG